MPGDPPENQPDSQIDKSDWPRSVQSITLEQLDKLGVDEEGHLYWSGVPVKTENRVRLSFFQGLFALAAAIATIGVFVIELLRYLNGN